MLNIQTNRHGDQGYKDVAIATKLYFNYNIVATLHRKKWNVT